MRIILLLALLLSACIVDEDPDVYVEALKPDLYFVIELPQAVIGAAVTFSTTRPSNPPMAVNLRLLTWANEGGNIYDETLGDTTIDSPTERGKFLDWASGAPPPAAGAFDKIALELRTFLPVVGYEPHPATGAYAEVDFMGAGIVGYGEWIDAILQLWTQCRGVVGQLIPCHGLHYVVAPKISFFLIGAQLQEKLVADKPLHMIICILTPSIYFAETSAGWYYREPAPGEYARWKPIDAYPMQGPFATAEEAARHAAATLDLSRSRGEWDALAKLEGAGGDAARALMAATNL